MKIYKLMFVGGRRGYSTHSPFNFKLNKQFAVQNWEFDISEADADLVINAPARYNIVKHGQGYKIIDEGP